MKTAYIVKAYRTAVGKAPKGVLINFNCYNIFKEGQKTFVNEYFKLLPKQ